MEQTMIKFDIGDLNDYTGEDLIFITGAPGSRFSGLYYKLCQHPEFNTSDWTINNRWNRQVKAIDGQSVHIGNHSGTYWGPGLGQGEKFDKLGSLSKAEILSELMQPFNNWDGIKLVKSHHWAYNLNYLLALFPRCKIVMCYGHYVDCFYWWQKCGGFSMTYPKYTWY
jgi:hypothetical protein